MSRSRSPKRSKKLSPRRIRPNLIEGLERRLLLTTVITDTDPLTPTPPTAQFEYKDARDTTVRVVVHGDVSAEFIWAIVKKGATIATLNPDFVPPPPPSGGTGTDVPGRDLFNIYIAQASIDSYISIAKVPAPNQGDQPRPMQPFDGSITLRINQLRTTNPIVTLNNGSVYLGARTIPADNSQNFGDNPIRQAGFHGIGIAPITHNQKLVAGIETASGVSLGRFLFGGTISGNVNIDGSMESFYCGNLLTGVTEGQGTGTPQDQNNFHIGSDIHNILVMGSVGTDSLPGGDDRDKPIYLTGVDFDIGGRVQQIKVGGSYAGFGSIDNNLVGKGLRVRQQELEVRIVPGQARGNFTEFQNGQFGDDNAFFNDDTFDTAQFLGSINSKDTGDNSVQVNGILQWSGQIVDKADYYAVALMAGQTVNTRIIAPIVNNVFVVKNGHLVRVTQELKSTLHVGVFDPDQRLVATDYSDQTDPTSQSLDADPSQQEVFSFTADRPGIYRFAVGLDAPGFGVSPGLKINEQPYQLQITGVGNIGLGGLWVGGTMLSMFANDTAKTPTSPTGALANIEVVHGDLGAIYDPTEYVLGIGGLTGIADGGDFRALDALDLGIQNSTAYRADVNIWALTGSVGMIRATDVESGTSATEINTIGSSGFDITPIGGNIQYVVTNNTLITDLTANGSIGVIQADRIGASNYAGSINANVDGEGKPGVIDLIDVTGDLGTIQAGGPDITTNTGGNVRYMRVGGQAYRPAQFGGGNPEQTTYLPGQSANITDDSGAQVEITPTQEEQLANGLPILDSNGNELNNSGTLTVLTYPIGRSLTDRGGGGVAIISVSSTRGMRITASGGSAEIGEVISTGTGPGLIADPGPDGVPNTGDEPLGPDNQPNTGDEPFVVDPTLDTFGQFPENGIELRGDRIDVFSIKGNNFDNIRNRTTGEIVSTDIGAVGRLEGNNIGIGASSFQPGMIVEGIAVAGGAIGDTFPFRKTKNAVVINGGGENTFAAGQILARQSIGNVIVTGKVQQISANADGIGEKGVFEGMEGTIFVQGQIRSAMVGEGLLSSGSGEFARAGIYCIAQNGNINGFGLGRIEKVVNQNGSDIRGNIVSNTGIGTIGLAGGGSIINANIEVVSGSGNTAPTGTVSGADLTASREFATVSFIRPNGSIDAVVLTGNGGIIGGSFQAFNFPAVNVEGFGIMNSTFGTVATGRFGTFIAGGYGYRGVTWNGGQSADSIVATGNGKRLSTANFSPSVRLGETLAMDPYFGLQPGTLTDINRVLGTTAAAPVRKGTSNSGLMDFCTVRVSRDLGNISASSMRVTELNIANNIGSLVNTSYSDTLTVTAGRIDSILIGADAVRTDIVTSGPVGSMNIGGSFRGSSSLTAGGQNGTIGSVVTDNTLYGNIYAQAGIGSIRVGTTYGSEGTYTPKNLGLFVVGNNFASNARLQVGKSSTDAAGRLTKLIIEGDFEDGGQIFVNSLGTSTILGADQGTIDTKPWA